MIERGQKSKPQKISGPKFNTKKVLCRILRAIKNFQKALNDITQKNRNINFEYPIKTVLKSSYPKNTCQNFTTQNRKFQTHKNPLIIPRSLEFRSSPGTSLFENDTNEDPIQSPPKWYLVMRLLL